MKNNANLAGTSPRGPVVASPRRRGFVLRSAAGRRFIEDREHRGALRRHHLFLYRPARFQKEDGYLYGLLCTDWDPDSPRYPLLLSLELLVLLFPFRSDTLLAPLLQSIETNHQTGASCSEPLVPPLSGVLPREAHIPHCAKQTDFGKEGDKHTTSVASTGNHSLAKLGGQHPRNSRPCVFITPFWGVRRAGVKGTAPGVLCGSDSRSRTAKTKLSPPLWGRRDFWPHGRAVGDGGVQPPAALRTDLSFV